MSSRSSTSLSTQLPSLLEKMRSTDSDLRVMALIDLNKDLTRIINAPASSSSSSSRRAPDQTYTDEYTEVQVTDAVIKLLSDQNAEVKNAAVSCIASMVRKARAQSLTAIISALVDGISSSDEERRDISCLALKSVVLEMPVEAQRTDANAEKLASRIFSLFQQTDINPQLASELLQILTDIFIRYHHIVAASSALQSSSIISLIKILSIARPTIRKRAIPALTALVSTNPSLFESDLKDEIVRGLGQNAEGARVWVSVVASLARAQTAPKIGSLLAEGELAELIISQASNPEDTETAEGAVVALEALTLRCPTEITSYLPSILERALALVKYDPNYVDLADDDVDMNDEEDEEDEDDEYDEAYSDGEDQSWKVRRAAAKLLHALIGTRNELLAEFYSSAAPVLTSRFGERQESVRLEVLSAFGVLLQQTISARTAELATGSRNKRKRSEGMDEDYAADDSAISYLRAILPQLVRAILKQLSSKSLNTRLESFILLREISKALNGGLEESASQICSYAATAVRSADSATASSLVIAALAFLAVFFSTHPARSYGDHLAQLVPAIVRCLKDKLQRVSSEAFAAASALAKAARPKNSSNPLASNFIEPIQQLFSVTTEILADPTVDADVREKALDTLGNLLVHEGDTFVSQYRTTLPLITVRLANENTATTAVVVIGKIADSPLCKGTDFDAWLLDVLPEVVIALRRTRRSATKNAEFACLSHILTRIGTSLPAETAASLIGELKPFIETPTALQIVAIVLAQQPHCREAVDKYLSPSIMEVVKTPSVNPQLIDALAAFFAAYVDGDVDCATRLVPALVENLGKGNALPDATRGGTSAYTTTSKIIGVIVAHSQRNAAGVLALFQKAIKSPKATEPDVYLALLCIGEIGRSTDLSVASDLFDKVLSFFQNDSEEVRSAAAFAAGNLAVGSPTVFLPAVVRHIGTADSAGSRLLLLHALKEVILRSSAAQLETLAETLWKPLFAGDETTIGDTGDIGDEGIRNVKAACIGKLTTTAPGKFLPQLQDLLKSSPRNKALVAAAVRYTFIDTSSSYDEIIAPIIVDFLSLMRDENLIVRRLSLASLNAAIQNKPHLIVDKLATLQPLLYQETYVRKELQREVAMGPWKVIEDDGLENRKTAYETMYTLLGTCFSKIDLPTFTDRVMASLADVNEVKVLGFMLLLRLGQLAPTSVIPRLDDVANSLKVVMKDLEVKDDTVKQDLERKEEMQRSALRAAVPLFKISTPQQAPAFHTLVEAWLASDKWREFRNYQA